MRKYFVWNMRTATQVLVIICYQTMAWISWTKGYILSMSEAHVSYCNKLSMFSFTILDFPEVAFH